MFKQVGVNWPEFKSIEKSVNYKILDENINKDIDKQHIDQLIKSLIKHYDPFDIIQWLDNMLERGYSYSVMSRALSDNYTQNFLKLIIDKIFKQRIRSKIEYLFHVFWLLSMPTRLNV
jgi:hypothetical protein